MNGSSWTSTEEARLELETWPDTRAVARSFYGAPLCPNPDELNADVAFLGVPFDLGTGVPGARFGPNSIRDTGVFPASVYSCSTPDGRMTAPGFYDIDSDRQWLEGVTMADCGDVPIVPSDVERNFWRITRAVRSVVARRPVLVAVGGDHAITPAVVRGLDSFGALDVVHFDAHHDFTDHTEGIRWMNGCPVRRVSEFPWVRNITQIGMRMTRSRVPIDEARARGNRIITTDRFRELGPAATIAQVPESDALYVTIDIDILDPTICPGTGAPEPGGLTYVELRDALKALAKRCRVVAFDVVEVSPPLDVRGLTSKTASRLIVDFLAGIMENRIVPADARVAAVAGGG
jgi:agmatinase